MAADLTVQSGDVFELWARRAPTASVAPSAALTFSSDGRVVYRIEAPPPYFEYFSYTHYEDGTLRLEWDASDLEVSLFYRFNSSSVRREGITLLRLSAAGLEAWTAARLPDWHAREAGRPTLRFAPLQGWMNDPNGLCKVGDDYHLFYQYHPNGTDWGPMHWGHAVSTDLYHWTHLPVFAHPHQNLAALGATGGAFSGSAFFDRDNRLSFYYTERLPAYDLFKDYKEIQRRMLPSPDLLRPIADRVVQTDGGPGTSHDVRDPKVWFDDQAGLYRMVLGSSVDGDPAIVLHSSHDGLEWSFTSVLYRAPARFREGGARCAECPDFFPLDGHWVLIAGFVGYTETETSRHNLLYAVVGDFADAVFKPYSSELQELDFGTDYYAMQSFWDGSRQLALAWLFNWEFRKPAGSVYSGELSLPRVLALNSERLLTMQPDPGYQRLRSAPISTGGGRIRPTDPNRAIELEIRGDLASLSIAGYASNGATFTLRVADGALNVSVPEDAAGTIAYHSQAIDLTRLQLFFDRGVLEIFANDGAVCGTRRTYCLDDLVEISVANDGQHTIAAWELQGVW